jgi:hypothetical protein
MTPRRAFWWDVATIIIVLPLLWSACEKAFGAEPWDATDKALGAAVVTTMIVDWGQTRYIAQHPDPLKQWAVLGWQPCFRES